MTTERTGAATATVSFFGKNLIPDVPGTYRGLQLDGTNTKQNEDGSYTKTATYKGLVVELQDSGGGGGGGGGNERDDKAIYSWSPTFEQTDISKHPRIDFLLTKYQGTVDPSTSQISFPQFKTDSKGNKSVNPMFGVTNFLSLGGTWSEEKLESSIPDDAFSSIGEIASGVPGGLPTPLERFWLTMPPIVQEHGDKWKVTRRWLLSGVASFRDVEAANDIY